MNEKGIHTEIVETIQFGKIQIVREHYFKYPNDKSNVYAKNKDGQIIWYAELPTKGDCYSNLMKLENENIKMSSWNGYTVVIDISNGQIIERRFTK